MQGGGWSADNTVGIVQGGGTFAKCGSQWADGGMGQQSESVRQWNICAVEFGAMLELGKGGGDPVDQICPDDDD